MNIHESILTSNKTIFTNNLQNTQSSSYLTATNSLNITNWCNSTITKLHGSNESCAVL